MNSLVKQLEDKKKGCNTTIDVTNDLIRVACGDFETYCPICQAEIAILEQAIAEMQKQRQEILEEVEKLFGIWYHEDKCDMKDYTGWYWADFIAILKQLNQPKRINHENINI